MKRLVHIDIIRLVAICGVLIVHTFNNALHEAHFDILRLPYLFFIERLFRFAVPVFFVASGYILAYRYPVVSSLKEFYQRRLVRIVIPYILWSILYLLVIDSFQLTVVFGKDFFQKLFLGTASIHLYFIPALVILNILFPLLLKYRKYMTVGILGVSFVIEMGLLAFDYYISPLPFFDPLRIALLNVVLFMIGIWSRLHEEKIVATVRIWSLPILGVTVALYGVIVQQTRYLYLTYEGVNFINSQWQPLIFLYALCVWFLLFAYGRNIRGRIARMVEIFSRLSFFVYFVHVLFISLFWRFWGSYLFNSTQGKIVETFWFVPMSFVFVLSCSYVSAYLVRFIPKLGTYVGLE